MRSDPTESSPATSKGAPFLSAYWKYLAMLNYEVTDSLLKPYLPQGTELDSWHGRVYVSLVGFLFLDTKVLGISLPFHKHFEEVNLRFYVRRKVLNEWRRGVVFIRELVPKRAIAAVARYVYNENYAAVPMSHSLRFSDAAETFPTSVQYRWGKAASQMGIEIECSGAPRESERGSEAEYITEHYWGYTKQRDGSTLEYQVTHPRWRLWAAHHARLHGEPRQYYEEHFSEVLTGVPQSAFLAEGSTVTVHQGKKLSEQ